MLFTIASNKQLGISLTKCVKDPYTESYKILPSGIEDNINFFKGDINKWKDITQW